MSASPPVKKGLLTPDWDAPVLHQVVRTLLFSAVMALVFTVVGFIAFASGDGAWRNLHAWSDYYVLNLGVAICIGACIKLLYAAGMRLLGRQRLRSLGRLQHVAFWAGLPCVGVVLGSLLSQALIGIGPVSYARDDNKSFGILLFTLLLVAGLYQYFATTYRRIDAERRASEAQLRLLQGQMEPHFLFNTLANVLGLMDVDAPRAKVMLEAFVDYLRSSLGSLRRDDHTLGDELTLVEAYLRIISIRMDTRLHYRIDVPEPLRALPMPPLTLQPLVENAVVHGLEPSIDGGTVTVTARREGDALTISVEDDGIGPAEAGRDASRRRGASIGTGTALSNIGDRLRHAHGGAASVRLLPVATGGAMAQLHIPLACNGRPP